MKKSFLNKVPNVIYPISLVIFFILNNLSSEVESESGTIFNRGFPFVYHRLEFNVMAHHYYIWSALIADILIAFACSVVIGSVFKFVLSKIS